MKLTEFTIKILILSLPGIVCYFSCQKLIGKTNRSNIEVIFQVFVFSIISYLILGIGEILFDLMSPKVLGWNVIGVFNNPSQNVSHYFLMSSAVCGVLLAFALSYIVKYNLLNKFGQVISATNRYGDEDVWQCFHDTSDEWVFIRDHKTDLVYYCYIRYWSDSAEDRELILSDVSVFNNTGDFLYESQNIYISRNKDDLTIEIPIVNED